MADDIVARLRDWKKAADGTGFGSLLGIFNEAADEIEKLRSELRSYTGDHHTIHAARRGDPLRRADPVGGES